MWILGGGVRGGRMVGSWPGLASENLEGPGDVPVATNYRDLLAPVLQRHGLSPAGVEKVFPGAALRPLELY